jgi:signal transduction histidine kinase
MSRARRVPYGLLSVLALAVGFVVWSGYLMLSASRLHDEQEEYAAVTVHVRELQLAVRRLGGTADDTAAFQAARSRVRSSAMVLHRLVPTLEPRDGRLIGTYLDQIYVFLDEMQEAERIVSDPASTAALRALGRSRFYEHMNWAADAASVIDLHLANHQAEIGKALAWKWRYLNALVILACLISGLAVVLARFQQRDFFVRQRAEAARDQSLALSKALIENMQAGVLVETPERQVFAVNAAFWRLFGSRAPEALPGSALGAAADRAADPDDFRARVGDHVARRQSSTSAGEVALQDGRTLEWDYYPIEGPDQRLRGHIWQFRDATERKRNEEALRLARDRAEEAARVKSSILANVSHELRTPLNSILGFTDLLQAELSGEQRELTEVIRSSGERLMDTLTSVLDLARIEAQGLKTFAEPVRVADVVAETMRMMEPQAHRKHLSLAVEVPGEDEAVALLDRTLLGRVLVNLVSNAVKFTASGGVRVVVDTGPADLSIRVEDTGIGISKEFLPHLFEEFTQEGRALGREGSGLGLTITKKMVELMGGTIGVESEKGRGSVFTVRFPRLVETSETEAPVEMAEA